MNTQRKGPAGLKPGRAFFVRKAGICLHRQRETEHHRGKDTERFLFHRDAPFPSDGQDEEQQAAQGPAEEVCQESHSRGTAFAVLP